MEAPELTVGFAPELQLFLPTRLRGGQVTVAADGTSTIGHLVESLGPPLTEVGGILADGRPVTPSFRPHGGESVSVLPVHRPQELPYGAARFVLDVHLGTLARRLRLLGVDTRYGNDMNDDALIAQANREERILLTQDRGLLKRRLLGHGAFVRGSRPDAQLHDVLDRFAPVPRPWTRCVVCNGCLIAVGKQEVEPVLMPGTRRTYDAYHRCRDCGRVYWHGAHSRRLDAIVDEARRIVGRSGTPAEGTGNGAARRPAS
ncbi:Mut7-C ubiquitin/RNAse domain-containing protein [Streptomyces meridianus]|uniref:Mut7-C ubiquitin/RNAse domain-containing protein n=1 Tax=Streptomyces meridianus TaxID=2938945 RepID=A0ABT0XCT4_9ACTN|nr:Mut7-C ubiquitin/RNAse domain-containing protein [Streptomyces meridianus]MCM2580326.1 Mut7-C ubiquitin/RNAse domain-containing protein [Streptomyces meridianus]